ncbi:MAG: TerC family protein [Alphaproteobacteria bacterium]
MIQIDAPFAVHLLEIIWINILLSGDNAVVIALACRALPPHQQKWGIILGTAPAVVLRIIFAAMVSWLMAVPWLKIVGGVILLWIAIDLMKGGDDDEAAVHEHASLWYAARTIVVADVVMSLDNVVAVAAAAKGDFSLLVIGLLISIPLVIVGSTLLLRLLDRFPVLVVAGAALLGFIAGELIESDPVLSPWTADLPEIVDLGVPLLLAALVVATGQLMGRAARRREAATVRNC